MAKRDLGQEILESIQAIKRGEGRSYTIAAPDDPTDFDLKVRQHIARFKQDTYQTLETEVARKRIAWFRQHYPNHRPGRASPRSGYELLFFEYLGLAAADVPVLSETDAAIVWRSLNRCPTLAACQQPGLDTRKVCRAVYEKSTQALLSQLDPQLRFHRSYQEIRPYAPHCQEWIIRLDFEAMLRLAMAEAQTSPADDSEGHGAVVVMGAQIVGKAHDTALTERDHSRHAEVNAIRQAVNTLGDSDLCGAVLFATHEPCPMCTALAISANLTTIVYGVSNEETAQPGKQCAQQLIENSPATIEVIGLYL